MLLDLKQEGFDHPRKNKGVALAALFLMELKGQGNPVTLFGNNVKIGVLMLKGVGIGVKTIQKRRYTFGYLYLVFKMEGSYGM